MKKIKWLLADLILGTSLITLPQTGFAKSKKTVTENTSSLQERINELEQNQKILQRKWEIEQEKAEQKDKPKESLNAGFNSKEGFYLKSSEGGTAIRLRGLLQADGRFFLNDEGDKLVNQFIGRRLRPIVEGDIGKYFGFKFTPDFGGGTASIQDAYADIKPFKALSFRVGKFTAPLGLERWQSSANLLSVELGLPTNLVPNRDLGALVFGTIADGVFSYSAGVFNGTIDGGSNDTDVSDGKDVVARLFAQPFKNTKLKALEKLGVGVAGSWGSQFGSATTTNLASQKSSGQNTFFSFRSDGTAPNTVFADGDRLRISPQGYYYVGPFGLFGEYVLSSQKVNLAGAKTDIANKAWQVAASYILTGEESSFSGIKVKNPINFKKGNWGAVELGARYNDLKIDDAAFPVFADPAKSASHAKAWGVVANWYLTNNYKFTVSYDHTNFTGGASGGADRAPEHALFTRLQVAY
ncbi:MAG: porin [Deltaproteobacteria bacterium]|nr:porin [Deltaproteobacteria bacterium]